LGATTAQVVNFTATVAYNSGYDTGSLSTTFSYLFKFGDGQIGLFSGGTIGKATHKYAAAGSYNVVVIAQETGSNALAKIQEVGRTTQLITPAVTPLCPAATPCNFTLSPPSPTAGQPATFTATVNGGTTPYTFSWNFGDSTPLGTTNPVTHTFATSGIFSVVLTITDSSTPTHQTVTVTHSVIVQPGVSTVTISTSLSPNPITVGGSVTDSATLSGNTATAGGTVTYTYFSGSTCAGTGTAVGSPVTVTNGVVPRSASQPFNTAGSFSWHAVYSGDSGNGGAASACEPLTVNQATPVISTTLSANAITAGGSVTDSATLASSFQGGGTVTYSFFTGSTCAGTGTVVGTPVTVTGGVVPNSASQTFPTAGSFSWNAAYSGDTNNKAATSGCEPLTVNPAISGVTISTSLSPNPVVVGGP
jgi:hypothetical protein